MRKLSRKFHFFLRFCTRKRSETYASAGYETQRRRQQKSKTWVSVAPQKGLMSFSLFFLKKRVLNRVNYWSQVGITVDLGLIPTLNLFCSSLHKRLLSTLPTLYNCWKNRLKVIPHRDQFFRSWSSGVLLYYWAHRGIQDFVLTTCIDTFPTYPLSFGNLKKTMYDIPVGSSSYCIQKQKVI